MRGGGLCVADEVGLKHLSLLLANGVGGSPPAGGGSTDGVRRRRRPPAVVHGHQELDTLLMLIVHMTMLYQCSSSLAMHTAHPCSPVELSWLLNKLLCCGAAAVSAVAVELLLCVGVRSRDLSTRVAPPAALASVLCCPAVMSGASAEQQSTQKQQGEHHELQSWLQAVADAFAWIRSAPTLVSSIVIPLSNLPVMPFELISWAAAYVLVRTLWFGSLVSCQVADAAEGDALLPTDSCSNGLACSRGAKIEFVRVLLKGVTKLLRQLLLLVE